MLKKSYHNNPAPKIVKIFGTVYEYNPVNKTYTIPVKK